MNLTSLCDNSIIVVIIQTVKEKLSTSSSEDQKLLEIEAKETRLNTEDGVDKFFEKHKDRRAKMITPNHLDISTEDTTNDLILYGLEEHPALLTGTYVWFITKPAQ